MATRELEFKLLEPIGPSVPLLKKHYDAEGKRITADSGEMFSKQVDRSLGFAGGRYVNDLNVVAFPVHLLAMGGRHHDTSHGF